MPDGSWKCDKYNKINYPYRTKCNRKNCGADKPSDTNDVADNKKKDEFVADPKKRKLIWERSSKLLLKRHWSFPHSATLPPVSSSLHPLMMVVLLP